MTHEENTETSQAEISRKYMQLSGNEKELVFKIGRDTLSHLTALGIIDDTTIAAQIRRGVEAYVDSRSQDPELPSLMASAEKRYRAREGAKVIQFARRPPKTSRIDGDT